MSFNRIYAVMLRQYYLTTSNTMRIASSFSWMLMDLLVWGVFARYLDTLPNQGINFTSILLSGIVLWSYFIRSQSGMMVTFLEDIWTRNFINFFASPLKMMEYLFGLVSVSFALGMIGIAGAVLLSWLLFGFSILNLGLYLFGFLIILFISGVALGLLLMTVMLKYGPSAEWLIWPIAGLLTPLAGVYYPISVLPASVQVFSRALPFPYVFDGMRSIILRNQAPASLSGLLIGLMLSIIYLVILYFIFARTYRSALRKGSIVRFSAESL